MSDTPPINPFSKDPSSSQDKEENNSGEIQGRTISHLKRKKSDEQLSKKVEASSPPATASKKIKTDSTSLTIDELQNLVDSEMPSIKKLFQDHLDFLKKDDLDDPSSEELAHKLDELMENINKNLGQKNLLELPLKLHTISPAEKSSPEEEKKWVDYITKIFQNKLKNQINFIKEAKDFIEKRKVEIFSQFEISNTNLSDIEFDLKLLGEESHNKGKVPFLVTFRNKKNELLKIVCKPRNAATDSSIIELFKQINQLHKTENQEYSLPFYKIFNFQEKEQDWSIWEYIQGENINLQNTSAEGYLKNNIPPSDKEKSQKNLLWLETICRKVGITDLHAENVLFKPPYDWVPIDLEVIASGQTTGLYDTEPSEKHRPPLSTQELSLIAQFLEEQKRRVQRFVPLATKLLINYSSDIQGNIQVVKNFKDSEMIKNKYKVEISDEKLQEIVKDDFLNGDIPFFTQLNEKIFYGQPQQDISVAQKQNK